MKFPKIQWVYGDKDLVVIEKPHGISSVPYDRWEQHTALQQLYVLLRKKRVAHRRIYVVHRIDKATSGLLVFALNHRAQKVLKEQFRAHRNLRRYAAMVHGRVTPTTIASDLVKNRGDGLRGSGKGGKRAITHLLWAKHFKKFSWILLRLETGRTHQIRIHLAEAGHPLIGERVYVKDYLKSGQHLLSAPRMMLHAQTLGFIHPNGKPKLFYSSTSQEWMHWIHSQIARPS